MCRCRCKVFTMDPLFKATLLRTFAFLIWILLSAWLFTQVEYTGKDEGEEKHQLLLSLYTSMASKYNMTWQEFSNFSNTAYEVLSKPNPQWTFPAAVDFVVQAATTIGYGNLTPRTPSGQILCIFTCLFGIPIALLTLNSVGAVISKLVNTLVKKFEKKILKKEEPKHVESKGALILFLVMVLLIVVNGLVMTKLEDWTFVEGVYFWFVTLTTMGFGDYIPKKLDRSDNSKKDGSIVLMGIWMMPFVVGGLCIVSSVLNSIVAAIDQRNWRFRCPGCASRRTQDHMDNTNMTSGRTENLGLENDENIAESL